MQRILYIANIRLPTQKAHGYQICKMCEAFSELNFELTLLHPRPHRRQSRRLRNENVFAFYDLRSSFSIRKTPNLDVVPLARAVPRRVFAVVHYAHSLIWGLYASLLAKRQAVDLCYTRDCAVAFWSAVLRLPTIFESHTVPKGPDSWMLQRVSATSGFRGVVALTSFIKRHFEELGFEDAKVVVCPDAVDLCRFESLPDKTRCRDQLSLPADKFILGYVGRFQAMGMEKGIPQLIEAVSLLSAQLRRHLHLLCVGGPSEAISGYVRLARRKGLCESEFTFHERVRSQWVPWWIKSCDIATIPWPCNEFSAYYTSPLKMFEYMAAGTPILASDLPSIREVLGHGRNAWLVKAGDSHALAQGIEHLYNSPDKAASLSAQGRLDVHNFQWKQRAERIIRRLARPHFL